MGNRRKWTMKELEFIRDNYKDLTLKEISAALNRNPTTIANKMHTLGLYKQHKAVAKHKANTVQKGVTNPGSTLCWNCANAYAHKCAWIRDGTKVWTKGITHKVVQQAAHDKTTYMELVAVTECPYFKLDLRCIPSKQNKEVNRA
jgi:hypothetical protein